MGYVEPTPIQVQAIPHVIAGRDVMGAAQTGTGKTAGFGLPLLQRILPKANTSPSPARHPVRALILTPTRELADQIDANIKLYASNTPIRAEVVFGGVDMREQEKKLRAGVDVLTATPGRLLDFLENKALNLNQVEVVVMDEADRMLDMGFLPSIDRIMSYLPKDRQSLLFSATFAPEIQSLAKSFLKKDPAIVEVARENSTADTVAQEVYTVRSASKIAALIHLLRTRGPENGPLEQVIVFTNAKMTCRRLFRVLQEAGIKVDSIHGDKTQEERLKALDAFKNGEVNVLVATDVAARGLDIKELPFVINFDVPFSSQDYVHRIGRTGRAGQTGVAVMLMTEEDEENVKAIEELIGQKFERVGYPLPAKQVSRRRIRAEEMRMESEEMEKEAERRASSYKTKRWEDPFFRRPYRAPRHTPKVESPSRELGFYFYHQKPRQKAVLLSGFPKRDED